MKSSSSMRSISISRGVTDWSFDLSCFTMVAILLRSSGLNTSSSESSLEIGLKLESSSVFKDSLFLSF